jgi:phage FluMu protein Com
MMSVYTEKVFALRCALCGKLGYHRLSVFSFSRARTVNLNCPCGFRKAIIGTKDNRTFWIQIPCIICETEHVFHYDKADFWTTQLENLACPDTDIDLGFFGDETAVQEAANHWEDDLSSGFNDYFINPALMFDVLNHLHDMADNRRLSCACGNREIEVDLYPDRLELRCTKCNRQIAIKAENEEDLMRLNHIEAIEIDENGFSGVDPKVGRSLYRVK